MLCYIIDYLSMSLQLPFFQDASSDEHVRSSVIKYSCTELVEKTSKTLLRNNGRKMKRLINKKSSNLMK